VIRVAFIAATMLVVLYLFYQTTSYVAGAIVVVFIGFQLVGLVRYVEKTNRDLSRFLHSVRYDDFSQSFTSDGRGSSFEALNESFSEVMDDFRKERSEKEENYRYLQTVMQHVGIGLVSFEQDGTVGLINTAAKRLLRVHHLKNIKALSGFSKELVGTMLQLRSGDKGLVQIADNDELLHLMIYGTEFKLRGVGYTLVSIQDIQTELEEKEIDAWQKLTRVLTHEIMNSITPISSLASTANELLLDLDPVPHENGQEGYVEPVEDTLEDVRSAVHTIEKRSQNLLHLVNAYRSLTRIPRPNLRIVPVAELFDNVTGLLAAQFKAQGVHFEADIQPTGLDLTADPELIEQVLINLLKNAKEAVQGLPDGAVTLKAYLDARAHVVIQVIDNGPGIMPEAMDKIFIPFFTTKKEGSGIGLSLSRQIMRQHSGSLTAFSEPDHRTVFTLRF
jgi:nitrogen fixation/metabolism regulation signal transduction histidine kinase